MSEQTSWGSFPSGTAWPETMGWCGHQGTMVKFQVGSLDLRLCYDCYNIVRHSVITIMEKSG